MIENGKITIYHKGFDKTTRLETWTRYIYNGWQHGGEGASLNEGYPDKNDVSLRIPYETNEDLNIGNFSIGDIIYIGEGQETITKQSDLDSSYNITSITNNTFGNNQHIHIGGK
jgi:hypothetical protein